MRLAAVLLALAIPICAEVLLEDDFDDGDADGWLELPTGATYQVTDGRYNFLQTSSDTVYAGSVTGDLYGAMSVPDYSVLAKVEIEAGIMAGLLSRFDFFSASGYLVSLLTESGGILAINRLDQGVPEILGYTVVQIVPEQEYWVRMEVAEGQIGAKIWTGGVSQEPANWNLTVMDATYSDAGSVGLFSMDVPEGGVADMNAWFDDFSVEDETSLDFIGSTWGGIKTDMM